MELSPTTPIDGKAIDALHFMASKMVDRPMLQGLIASDIERWSTLGPRERVVAFERGIRRFATVCPSLAKKDKVLGVREALKRQIV